MPAVCPTVIITDTPRVPAGAAQFNVVADIHATVLHSEVPNRTDGVMLVPAKFRPVIVTEPVPHVAVFWFIW